MCGSSLACAYFGGLHWPQPPALPSTVHSFVPAILAAFWSLGHSISSPLLATGPLHMHFCLPRHPLTTPVNG